MRKTPLILVVGVIAALILGDVIEIRFHGDKLAGLPQAVAAAAKDGSIYEKARAQAISAKRLGERYVIRDERQRLEIALGYVEKDSERLRRLAQRQDQPEKAAAQARLLEQSLEYARDQSKAVSVEDLLSLKDKVGLAFATASETLEAAGDLQDAFVNVKNRLAEVKQVIETQVGNLKSDQEEGAVAGSQAEGESPTPDIPLKF